MNSTVPGLPCPEASSEELSARILSSTGYSGVIHPISTTLQMKWESEKASHLPKVTQLVRARQQHPGLCNSRTIASLALLKLVLWDICGVGWLSPVSMSGGRAGAPGDQNPSDSRRSRESTDGLQSPKGEASKFFLPPGAQSIL